ncbi:TetR/AcrR family transcriptional regulator [Amycolatopsis sp. H20-H5]|uniref:TetR/AcrR family transcriptional regulator n=1 Tax=Amycolatopsis sp. H20-H5 TaxID=3046309 RepID=UPI002DBCA070|nr:TetR/AcrR family transcriptional regulator [Amycolatopsis sp. H20-H5]MEC3980079.1 TetR/AcrR family transcriptional regulator [Amycolatopsis sp. H20-H5]
MSKNVSGQPQERHIPDERRKAAMEAVLHLLSTVPYDDILVADIAAAAGMSRPLLYHYFGGKEQVTAAALHWAGERMVAGVQAAAASAGSNWLAVTAGIHAYLDNVVNRSDWHTARVRYARLPGPPFESVRNEVRDGMLQELHRRIAPRGGSPILRLVTLGWIDQVEAIVGEWSIMKEPSLDQVETLLCQLLLAGLQTGAALDAATANAFQLLTDKTVNQK